MRSFAWGSPGAAFLANQQYTIKAAWQVRQEPRSAKGFFAVLTGRLLLAGTEPSCEGVSQRLAGPPPVFPASSLLLHHS